MVFHYLPGFGPATFAVDIQQVRKLRAQRYPSEEVPYPSWFLNQAVMFSHPICTRLSVVILKYCGSKDSPH